MGRSDARYRPRECRRNPESLSMYGFLADVVVVVHFAFVAGVVLGQLLIVIGVLARWQWIRNAWFRCIHLLSILFVAFEYVFGIACPLTLLELHWRRLHGAGLQSEAFMIRLLRGLFFCPVETENTLTVAACVFAGLVVLTFIVAPPRFRRRPAAPQAPAQEGQAEPAST